VHTDIGHHCAGARVNGRLVPLRTPLGNGDMVEVITNPNRAPSRDWLNLVGTSRAKNKIRQWLNAQQKNRAMELGQRMLEREARRYRASYKKLLENPALGALLVEEGLSKVEDLFSRIGFGRMQPRQVLVRLLPAEQLAEPPPKESRFQRVVSRILPQRGGPIEVKGHGDVLAYLAKCCNPLPGEGIVGYVTRGHGISVHSVDCPNVKNLLFNPEREIEVDWAKGAEERYRISLVIETEDRPGILAKLTDAIAKLDTNITQIDADTLETGRGEIQVVVELRDLKHLEKLRRGIQAVPGVLRVDRRMGKGATAPAEALP
jgi:GTP pyrophosphokinase